MNQRPPAGGKRPAGTARTTHPRPRREVAGPSGALDPARLLEGVAAAVEPAPTGSAASAGPDDRPQPSPARQMNAELRVDAGRIFANWVVRITNLPHFRARPDFRLAEVKRGMPELVIATIDALAAHNPVLDPEPSAAVVAATVSLARARAAAGFSLGEVLAEVQELRLELLAAIWRIVDAAPALDDAPRDVIARLVALGGDLLIAVSEDWVERLRDLPIASTQAESMASGGAEAWS